MQNLYTISVPTLVNVLTGLKQVLAKAEAFAKEKGISEEVYLNEALAPDMFPLKKQVQVASDQAKGLIARLTGKENPTMEDTETTFVQLQQRIDKTLAFVQSVSEADFAEAEERQIPMKYFPGKYMLGADYALQYAIPNVFFHVTTAYGIVRKSGASIGKADFIGGLPLKDL